MPANGTLVYVSCDHPREHINRFDERVCSSCGALVPEPAPVDDGKVGCITCSHRGAPANMVPVCRVSETEHEYQCQPCRYGL
jgi:hypothetical protein